MTRFRVLAAGLVAVLFISSCGSETGEAPSPVDTRLAAVTAERDELREGFLQLESDLGSVTAEGDELVAGLAAVTAERDELREGFLQLESDLGSVTAEGDELVAGLAAVTAERDELREGFLQLESDLASVATERDELVAGSERRDRQIASLESELREASASAHDAQEEVQYLLSKYDEQIRADLQAAIDTEIERACVVASGPDKYETPVTAIIRWQTDWEPITTRMQLEQAVEKCAEPERRKLRIAALRAAVDDEIERACSVASVRYQESVESVVRWDSAWEEVTTRLKLERAVEKCAESERKRLAEERRAQLRAAVDDEIERACSVASVRYQESVESVVRWDSAWEEVTTRLKLERAVEKCAESERKRLAEERRAQLRAAVDDEIERACSVVSEQRDRSASSVVRWFTSWGDITTQAKLVAAVEDCTDERRAEFLSDCERIQVDQIQKNPDGNSGRCLVMYARIVQFDSATGPCSFHAELSRSRSTRWYDYDVRSTFGYLDQESTSSLLQECPELDDIDADDYIKVWATVLGSLTYDTTAGGTNHVPSFRIEKVELVRKE